MSSEPQIPSILPVEKLLYYPRKAEMSSSHKATSRGRSKFPTAWSAWEWTNQHNCDYRWRQIADTGSPSDFEYEYYTDERTPRDLEPTYETTVGDQGQQEIYGSPPADNNYTYNTENVTAGLAGLNIAQGYTPAASVNSYTTSYTTGQSGYSTTPLIGRGVASSSGYTTGATTSYDPSFATPHSANTRHISTKNPGSSHDFDPNFKFHQSWEFTFGRVFKVLWSEPTGSGGTEVTRPKGVRKAKYGESAYDSVRRFVIIREGNGHCICLPILTYGGQGTMKRGVHPEDHAVIYSGRSPAYKDGEKISKKAVHMIPKSSRHKLDPASRINYAKVYTVEHNVKVWFVGQIAEKHEQRVVTDYNVTHQPLPDRPYHAQTGEDTYAGAQGNDPTYYTPDTDGGPLASVIEEADPGDVGEEDEPEGESGTSYQYQRQDDLYDP